MGITFAYDNNEDVNNMESLYTAKDTLDVVMYLEG